MNDSEAASHVRTFLDAMERRDLDAARRLTAPDFRMTFPGNRVFSRLEDLVSWSADRWSRVAKSHEGVDVCRSGSSLVVYCRGTLFGALPDGAPFEGVRFIDRFVVKDGLIAEQMVWNDAAESLGRPWRDADPPSVGPDGA